MKRLLLIIPLMILLCSPAMAQKSIPLPLGFEAPIGPISVSGGAENYWDRYADVAADPYYGRSNPMGAWIHYSNLGKFEGRTWIDDTVLSGYCNAPVTHGWNCLSFPNGAEITSIQWQSSVKPINHEVLFHLVATPAGGDIAGEHLTLCSTHHIGTGPTMVFKPIILMDPLIIPSGWTVWVYAEGWSGVLNLGGIEVQTTIWIRGY